MKYEVFVTADAEDDLEDIYTYLAEYRTVEEAEYVKGKLLDVIDQLERFPNRGTHPADLMDIGSLVFREVFFKPYRIIYRVLEKRVYIYVVTDGRRNVRSLLAERLLR